MAKRRKLVRDESTPEKRQWWDAVKAAAAQAPRLEVSNPLHNATEQAKRGLKILLRDGGSQHMAPTEQAMRAARAWLNDPMRFPTYELGSVEHLADLIDRETGLPELLYEQIEAWREVETLRARLAAVEALHTSRDSTWSGSDKKLCSACSNFWPCPTLRAARGEHDA